MLISYFSPNEFHRLFVPYVRNHRFLHNSCTKEVDLIYCGSGSLLHKAMAAKQQYGKPLICWVWDLPCFWRDWARNDKEFNAHKHRDGEIAGIVANLRKCDKVVTGSKYSQRILKEKYSIPSEQFYFYISTKKIDQIPASGHSRGHIIQIGRFALNKRVDVTIRAMAGISRKFICMGKGDISGFQNLATSLNVNVEFLREKSTEVVIGLLKRAEILVSPSLHEGWGITPIEALYCGIPVLLNDHDVFREVYGNAVLYHKPDDADDMREKLRRLLSDKQLQRKMVEDCRPLIAPFTIAEFVKRWEKVIA